MLPNFCPAFVRAVDANRERREIRVEIPPYTDGAQELPVAEMCYPMGCDSTNTEIRIVVGMPVWVAFRNGDERYPIIVGHRPVNTGNEQSTRRWNHDNFEFNADKVFTINAGEKIALIVGGTSLVLTPESIAAIASALSIKGPVTQTGGDITSDGISVQKHPHISAAPGSKTSVPQPS
ncbi:hypothetical protein [Pseudomonas sp. MPR-ANC1]|uniref:hypothetical protein n=1 Tax=Pseudomonas sp. MPR-ANC1 TaxID=2075548 RepID=UPI0011AEE937|nr:hypothetical protein [Pseudomonas sp. MPR-ANC1]